MKIIQTRLREVKIPLRFRFSQSNNAGANHSHAAVVEVHTKEGAGSLSKKAASTIST